MTAKNPQALLLAELKKGPSYGHRLVERTGLSSGCVYENLRAMASTGEIEEAEVNEEHLPSRRGRPRIYYRLVKP